MVLDTETKRPRFEQNQARRAVRYRSPAGVKLADIRYDIADWSFEGFGLRELPTEVFIPPDLADGNGVLVSDLVGDDEAFVFNAEQDGTDGTVVFDNIFPIDVVFTSAACEIAVRTHARLVWSQEGRAGFTFVDPPPELRQQMTVQLDLHGGVYDENAEVSFMAPPPTPAPLPQSRTSIGMRLAFYAFAGLALAAAIGILVRSRTLVHSVHAQIVAATTEIVSPAVGELKRLHVKTGDRFKTDAPLFVVEDGSVVDRIRNLEELRNQRRDAVRHAEQVIEHTREAREFYRQLAEGRLAAKQAELAHAETQAAFSARALTRATQLAVQGLIRSEQLDMAQRQNDLAAVHVQAVLAGVDEAMLVNERAAYGMFFTGTRDEGSVAEHQLELARQRANLAAAQLELDATREQLQTQQVHAHHDGRVVEVLRQEGSPMRRGDLVLRAEMPGQLRVYALFETADSVHLDVGMRVEIDVRALGVVHEGAIERIMTATDSLSHIAVTIVLDQANGLQPGLQARTNVRIPWRQAFR